MAARLQVATSQLVTVPHGTKMLSEETEHEQGLPQAQLTSVLQLPGAVGQPSCPTPKTRRHALPPGKAKGEDSGQTVTADGPSDNGEPARQDVRRLSTLEKIAVLAGMILIIPPFAVLSGVSAVHCFLAWSWLCLSFMLVFTVLLFLNGRISRSTFAKLWNSFPSILTRSARPPVSTE